MTIADTDAMVSGMVRSVRGQVGSLLADMPSQDSENPLKAVLKDIQGGPRSDYPFITITLLRNDKANDGWLRNIYVDENDKPVYVTEQEIPLKVTCYGDSASSILTQLRVNSVDPWERSDMSRQVGAIFQDYTDVIREPKYLETGFVNSAYMTATFLAVSEMVSATGSIIEHVTGEGRYLDYEGDTNPMLNPFDVDNSS